MPEADANHTPLSTLVYYADQIGKPDATDHNIEYAKDKIREIYADISEEQQSRMIIDSLCVLRERNVTAYAALIVEVLRDVPIPGILES